MTTVRTSIHPTLYRLALASVIAMLCSATAPAQNKDKKTSAPAPKAAAPAAHAATTAHPGGTTTTAHGPTTSSASHGPITANPHGATTTNSHAITTTNSHPTTTGGTGRSMSTNVGHRPASATPHATMAGRPVPANNRVVTARNGAEVRMRPNGRPGDVHMASRGMDIHHGLNGNRRVVVERRDGTPIVAERGGRGYVQHAYMFHGHEYGHRTYYYHGRAYDRFYRRYPYHGVYVDVYSPVVYYRPAFYGWAYNPWVAPVSYTWGWAGNPWYGYYGYYFTPYPVYASASLWLTDYMISVSLAAAYQAQVDAQAAAIAAANSAPLDAAPLSPDVKDLISQEVQRQIALENAEAQTAAQNAEPDPGSSGIQRMLTDNVAHTFITGNDLDVTDANGQECSLSQGDALQLTGPPPADSTTAALMVLSSKGGQECRKSATVNIAITDLQEMQNHMRETIDQGMGELQAKQGHGIPALPASAGGPPIKAPVAAAPDAPGPDPNAATQITQQANEADQAEKDTLAQVNQSTTAGDGTVQAASAVAPATPVTLSLGMSIDDVVAQQGQPKKMIDLGPKKIYIFNDIKVTFRDGKVTDIQ